MEKPSTFKKRHRIPSSCSVCRKRKSKCDRARPVCGLCKKKSIAHLCYYEGSDRGGVGEAAALSPPDGIGSVAADPQSAPPHSMSPPLMAAGLVPPDHNAFYRIMDPSQTIFPGTPPQMAVNNLMGPTHHLAPPPVASPLANAIPMPDPASASPNYRRDSYKFQAPPPASAPNEKSDSFDLTQVSIGPNSTIQINPKDTIGEFFTNASFPVSLEGQYLANHGVFSYVGLTKSDRFVKFFRRFAVELLRKGEISQFVAKMKRKKGANSSSPANKKARSTKASFSGNPSPTNMSSGFPSVNSNSDMPPSKSPDSSKSDPMNPPVYANLHKAAVEDDDPPDVILGNDSSSNVEDDDGDESDHKEEPEGDEEDILVITRINVAKEKPPPQLEAGDEKVPLLSILPGLKALYAGPSHSTRKEYYKIVEKAVFQVIPNQKNLFLLVCRYFKWIHPFLPIVDETTFFGDVQQVIDGFPKYQPTKDTALNIKSDRHLLTLAMLLLMTRLAYLSLIHNHSANNQYNQDEILILNEAKLVTVKEFADVINLCIPDEHTSQRSSFRMVQTLTLLYFYRQVAPNDCHGVGGADSQILFGTLVRHALSIGLNRDPLKYTDHEKISKTEDLHQNWRHLWNYLVVADANTAIQRGSVLDIYSTNIGDVSKPDLSGKTGELEVFYNLNLEISQCYRELAIIFSNHKEKPRIVDLLKQTNELEHVFFKFFGKDFFKNYICSPAVQVDTIINGKAHEESYLKVMKYIMFINLRTNLTTIYYIIAIHYEIEYNKTKTKSMNAGIELFKIHFKSVVQLVYIMSFVFDNSVELFGKNYDYILTAANERCMIKTHSFLTSFFIRLIHQKQQLTVQMFEQKNLERLEAVNALFNMILVEAELFVGNFRKLSLRYVNSYKIYVLTYYVLKQCMENSEVFFMYAFAEKASMQGATNMLQFFSASELNYLCKLCEEFRVAKDIQTRQKRIAESTGMSPSTAPKDQTDASFNINQLNPIKDLPSNLFRIPRDEESPTMTDATYYPSINNLTDLNESNIPNEEFLRLFELYGDSSINID